MRYNYYVLSFYKRNNALSSEKTFYTYFKNVVSIIVPAIVFAVIILAIIKPATMDWLGKEDNLVETISATSLFLASLTAIVFAIYSLIAYRRYVLFIFLLLTSIVAFLIGMEEISWMQRILSIESNEFFLENNAQLETNIHNLATTVFEIAYATGAFIFLIILPFFHRQLNNFFSKRRLFKWVTFILPSKWLFIPFAAIVGLLYPHHQIDVYPHYLIVAIVIITTLLLVHHLAWPKNAKDEGIDTSLQNPLAVFGLLCIITGYITFTYIDYAGVGIRLWAASEYGEVLIAIGILTYVLDIAFRGRGTKGKVKPARSAK